MTPKQVSTDNHRKTRLGDLDASRTLEIMNEPDPEHFGLPALDSAFDAAIKAIAGIGDRRQRLAGTASLRARIDEYRRQTSELRDRTVAEIWRAEELSLSRLANEVGVSKARADQIVRGQTGRPVPTRRKSLEEQPWQTQQS
jgi:hypothetical protein